MNFEAGLVFVSARREFEDGGFHGDAAAAGDVFVFLVSVIYGRRG